MTLGLLVCALAMHAAPRIGTITIRCARLFDAAEVRRGGFYEKANLIAVPTQEKLIRKLLLFREGEDFDAAKLEATERRLRTLDFLKSASVTAGEPHDGVVDVTVTTQDALTTDINADFSNDGGRSLYDFEVLQKDILGSGSEVAVERASGRERVINAIRAQDPLVFGRYWNASGVLAKNSDGNEEQVALERPLFTHATHITGSFLGDHLLQVARTYELGVVASEFRQQHRELALEGGAAIAFAARSNTRLIAGIDFQNDRFGAQRGAAPADRDFKFAQIGFDETTFRFVKSDYIDFGNREQDFNIGTRTRFTVGRSPHDVWRLRGQASYGFELAPREFVLTALSATTRAGSTNRDAIVSSDTLLVMRWPTSHPLTLVSRLRVDSGTDLDRDVQFFADGQNGLRAYPNYAFEGARRMLFNIEQRFFLGRELLQIVEPGAAVFFDTGEAGPSFRARNLRTDFGAGLRLAIERLDSAIIRVDVGYAVNASPLSKRGMVVSVATSQAF